MRRSRTNILAMEKRTPGVAVVHDNLPEIQNGRAPVPIVYQKGGWTLHMLRGVIGTEKFWAGIREYYRRYRDSNASTEDLRRVMEETSGADLGWFFQQWLYRPGSPVVSGGWKYNPAAKKIEIDLAQTQSGDGLPAAAGDRRHRRRRAPGDPARRVHRQVAEIRDSRG